MGFTFVNVNEALKILDTTLDTILDTIIGKVLDEKLDDTIVVFSMNIT